MDAEQLDEALTTAMRVATSHHLVAFHRLLSEHQCHETFTRQDWPMSLELGFTCACSGHEQEFRIRVSTLKQRMPEVREVASRVGNWFRQRHGNKKLKRLKRRANHKAKSLLYRFLSKQAKWQIRAEECFEVLGSDGHRYQLTLKSVHNVIRLNKYGEPKFGLCCISTEDIPLWDLVLAQKLMLETDAVAFVELSNKFELPKPPMRILRRPSDPPEVRPHQEFATETLDNPGPYVRQMLASSV